MFKNHLKIAWRSLWKNKGFTFLNIVGLSIAFGVAILLCMAALFELSNNDFHKNADSIYKIYTEEQTPDGVRTSEVHPMPFSPALKEEVPGIRNISRYLSTSSLVIYKEKEFNESIGWIDAAFLDMFTFSIYKGSSEKPLPEGLNIAVTKKIAEKIFGTTDVIGQTVQLMARNQIQTFTISAVLENMPANSSLEFGIIGNFENSPRYKRLKNEWDHNNHEVYIELEEDVSAAQFEKQTQAFTKVRFEEKIENAKRAGAVPDQNGQYRQLQLVPLRDIYFTSSHKGKLEVSRTLPYTILGIAGLLLFIACINFINMSVAKSNNRLQEIGMRKALGGAKKHVFFQFWMESILIFLVTVAVGVVISTSLENQFRTIFDTKATLANTFTVGIGVGAFLLFFIITLLAGGYPAALVSKLGTLQALKGKIKSNGQHTIRDFLMIVQFAVVILLISGSFVLIGQLNYMQNKDLGFYKEQIISLPLNSKKDSYEIMDLLRNKLKSRSYIVSVAGSRMNLGLGKDGNQSTSGVGFDYKNRKVGTNMLIIDQDYIKTLGLTLISGRDFHKEVGTDSLSVIINEAMAKELREEDPIGKQLAIVYEDRKHTVVGVIKDYHFRKLNEKITPMTFFKTQKIPLNYAYIRISSNSNVKVLDEIKDVWKEIEPNADFLGSFLDENIDRTLRKEKNIIAIITSGAIVAIILSCFGLLAISLLVVNQRTKEIGVRKVVGASITSLLVLLTKDFIKLVVIAFLVITPVAWWYSHKWLQLYSYRIELNVWIFVVAGVLATGIAFATISFGTLKAALQNPIKSLKTE